MSKTPNPHIRLITAVLTLAIWPTTVTAETIYVDADAPGPIHNGNSWPKAYNYLQDALADAVSGDQIRMAAGSYKPDTDAAHPEGTGSRAATFALIDGVELYGGYAGFGEPDPNHRDAQLYKTILTGDLNGDDGPDFTNYADNTNHLVTGSNTGATTILDGFTITGGNASGSTGGGMYNNPSGSLTINNCRFENNLASNLGGGMYNRSASNPTITDTQFINNSAATKDGGGIYNHNSNPTFSNCLFSGNSAQRNGGAMCNVSNSNPDIVDCRFSVNFADDNGGAIYNSASTPDVGNCTFTANLTNGNGGGIYNHSSDPCFSNCLFVGNSAENEGGGIYNYYADPQLINSTFNGNSAGAGGGMYNNDSNPELINSIFWGNIDDSSMTESAQINGGSPQVTYSCIQDDDPNDSYIPFDCPDCNNIDDDPMFVQAPSDGGDGWGDDPCTPGPDEGANDDFGDLHLLPGSPCIDTGDNSMADPCSTDLDGNPRILDGNGDEVAVVDMGPYEHEYVPGGPKYCGGTGTAEDPYLICEPNHMQEIGANPDDWDKHFKLIADIDLVGYTGTEFNIIGDPCVPFTGVFDANNHTINNFTYTSTGTDHIGLFVNVGTGGQIKDLRLTNVNVDAGTGEFFGGLVGGSHGTVSNCQVTGSVTGQLTGGGLVGANGGTVSNCYATVYVTGGNNVGGLAGANQGMVSNCQAAGTISGDWDVGGLVGWNGYDTVSNCYATGSVSGETGHVGGLVGWNWYGTVSNCYATGPVSGTSDLGGLVGGDTEGSYTSSFWDSDVNPTLTGIGDGSNPNVIGKTTAEMMQEATFTNWDFSTPIWKICDGAGYPKLWWEYRALDGDVSNDCQVNLVDLAIVSLQWLAWPGEPSADIAPPGGDGEVNDDDLLVVAANWLTGAEVPAGEIIVNLSMDESWMYQNLSGSNNSDLTATASIISDPAGNNSYSYTWEFVLPGDVTIEPSTVTGGGASDTSWNFAAPSVNQPDGLSDSGQAITVRITVTGDDYANSGSAEAQFGIALLGDVNNDKVVNIADRSIINAFWRTGTAGSFTLRDCDINSDGTVNIADRSIANAVWRGQLGQNSVSQPCPLR